jgi:hypothetical protein
VIKVFDWKFSKINTPTLTLPRKRERGFLDIHTILKTMLMAIEKPSLFRGRVW